MDSENKKNVVKEDLIFKKKYESPKIEVTKLEMEDSLAAGSVRTGPNSTNGIVDPVSTDWESSSNQNVDIPL